MPRVNSSPSEPEFLCRTCKGCRQKKVKCDGRYPTCGTCRLRGRNCEYLQDGRKSALRGRRSEVRALQKQVQELRSQLSVQEPVESSANPESEPNVTLTEAARLSNEQLQKGLHRQSSASNRRSEGLSQSSDDGVQDQTIISIDQDEEHEPLDVNRRLSSPERDAEEGETHVYGATSLLHDSTSGNLWMTPKSNDDHSDGFMKTAARDRLMSHATVSKQKEILLYAQPNALSNVDFDGVPPDMAMHLLDLHWNRLHLQYLLTYRPAIMDSLFTNGPYVNKLLLNAIYLQSSLYSDRNTLRLDSNDPQTTGMAFYDRFQALLTQYLERPTMPTVVGLLLCGSCLVLYGKQSTCWLFSGMAYRMMVDLGYHLEAPGTIEQGANVGLTTTDREIRRRVYWGAYACDKSQSLFFGRPPAVHLSDSNISHEYLDSYEEMEEWRPYLDFHTVSSETTISTYRGQPSYAVSTFQSLLGLSKITAQVIEKLYSVKSAEIAKRELSCIRDNLRDKLNCWNDNLPAHLQFEPGNNIAPPPHQISLLTTYWTLVILVEQAFLNRGYFNFTDNAEIQKQGRRKCVHAAKKIWRLLEAYKSTFTFRHAHYGLYYAAYSAVLVMLQHAHEESVDYIDCIRFFWVVLLDYQKGCARGLRKPFRLLKSLMQKVKKISRQINVDDTGQSTCITESDMSQPSFPAPSTFEPGTFASADIDIWPESLSASWLEPWPEMIVDGSFSLDNSMFGFFSG